MNSIEKCSQCREIIAFYMQYLNDYSSCREGLYYSMGTFEWQWIVLCEMMGQHDYPQYSRDEIEFNLPVTHGPQLHEFNCHCCGGLCN
jgi:hypothetical protein